MNGFHPARSLARTLRLRAITIGIMCVLCVPTARSQDTARHYFYEPKPLHPGEKVMNIGLSLTLLPEPIVEQEIPAPAVDVQFKYGLSQAISLYGSLSTNYFTNVLVAGAQYNIGDEALSFSVGDGMAFFAGFITLQGEFDKNTAAAVANIPILRVGHRFERATVSLSLAATYLLHADTRIGSLEDRKGLDSRFNDVYCTLALEQPFFGTQLISTGISVTFSRTPYQSWMLYNTFDQYLMLPEFFFSFQL